MFDRRRARARRYHLCANRCGLFLLNIYQIANISTPVGCTSLTLTHVANITCHINRLITAGMRILSCTVDVLSTTHPSYRSLKRQFLSKWQNGPQDLKVERFFKVEVRRCETVNSKQNHALFAERLRS